MLTRLPDFEIDETAVVEYPNWSTIGGWASLPATFTPGPRLASVSVAECGRRRVASTARSPAIRCSPSWPSHARRSSSRRCSCCTGSQLVVRLPPRARRPAPAPAGPAARLPRATGCPTSPTRPYTLAEQADIVVAFTDAARRRRARAPEPRHGRHRRRRAPGPPARGRVAGRRDAPSAHERQHLHRDGAPRARARSCCWRCPTRRWRRSRRSTARWCRRGWRRRSARVDGRRRRARRRSGS